MDNLEEPLAVGRTAEIYPFGDGKVLKLFFPTIPQAWIDKEVETGRYIQDAGLPVPKVYETVRRDGRAGVVYERIEGPSLLNQLGTKPWNVVRYARLLAGLHAQVHDVSAPPGLETQHEWATGGIPESAKLPEDLRDRILRLLASMPEGEQLCHGDFHPGNIIVTQRGPVIIDWMTAY
ncbi:MAG: phosphotransferase, partial [Anaerolineae bacterium]|nr:phosphotransferase [Anaerolineae bacterium]